MGRTVIVTGATSGIGLALSDALLARGMRLITGVRDPARAVSLRAIATRLAATDRVVVLPLDLSSMASVRAFAAEVRERAPRIDAAIFNAAVVTSRREETVDGHERQFAVNHLAHFLLARELMPALLSAAPSRVIVVASKAADEADLDFDDLQSRNGYDHARTYARSKRANVLFALALARRFGAHEVSAVSLHPGIVPTALLRTLRAPGGPPPRGPRALVSRMRATAGRVKRMILPARPEPRWWDTPEEAAARIMALLDRAITPEEQGMFFVDGNPRRDPEWALDGLAAQRLWQASEALVAGSGVAGAARV